LSGLRDVSPSLRVVELESSPQIPFECIVPLAANAEPFPCRRSLRLPESARPAAEKEHFIV